MADVELIGHAHAAVQLHRVLADEAAGLAHLHLEGGGRLLRLRPVALIHAHGRHVHQGLGLFVLHEHIDHAVLQHLELADGLAELLARLAVFHGVLVEHLHAAHGFGAHRQDAFVDDLFEQRQAAALPPNQGVRGDFHIGEGHFGGGEAIDGGIVAAAEAGRRSRH